jgi:hypothetical protein
LVVKIAKTFKWGAVEVTVAVPDPSKLARPEHYHKIDTAVSTLAGLLNEALDDDKLINPDDKQLDIVRPKT